MIHRILHKIKEFPGNVKHVYQRAKKGYSYRDVWNIDSWFMEIMPKMLTDYKNDLHGAPSQFVDDETDPDGEKSMEAWIAVLDRMIFCFQEMNEDTCSMKNEYEEEYYSQLKPFKDWFTPYKDEHGKKRYRLDSGEAEPELEEKYRKRIREINEYREKMKNEGLELFREYFWDLWD